MINQNGHHRVVELLLNAESIEVEAATQAGATPLLVASQNARVEVVCLLLARGDAVDVNRGTTCKRVDANNGVTPLFAAATNGHVRVVQMLLERGDVQVGLALGRFHLSRTVK